MLRSSLFEWSFGPDQPQRRATRRVSVAYCICDVIVPVIWRKALTARRLLFGFQSFYNYLTLWTWRTKKHFLCVCQFKPFHEFTRDLLWKCWQAVGNGKWANNSEEAGWLTLIKPAAQSAGGLSHVSGSDQQCTCELSFQTCIGTQPPEEGGERQFRWTKVRGKKKIINSVCCNISHHRGVRAKQVELTCFYTVQTHLPGLFSFTQ